MWKKWMALGLCVLSICSYTYVGLALGEQRALAEQMLRLHIVANSDEAADQGSKLRVRDALLPRITALTRDCHTREEAEAALAPHLEALAQTAARVLAEDGDPQGVRVLLTTEPFPRRDYDTFSLPAGSYRSLRVILGEGAGHNWWCVAFPGLCLPATVQEVEAVAADAGLSEEEQALLTDQSSGVELKFRTLEWLQALRTWLGS